MGSRSNLTVSKEVSNTSINQTYFNSQDTKKLIPFVFKDQIEEHPESSLKLTFIDDFTSGLNQQATPWLSEFSLKHPQNIIPFLFTEELSPMESIRILTQEKHGSSQLSFVKIPDLDKSEAAVITALGKRRKNLQFMNMHKYYCLQLAP